MISEEQKEECRKIQLRLLDSLNQICIKNNIEYWIDFGTLLGAKRNKKFIPWDDDIDVSMPIKDYRKFIEIAQNELPVDIFLQTPKTDPGYRQYFSKLRDCNSTFLEHHETGKESYHEGIYIDIFPSVYYPKLPYFPRKVLLYFTVRSRYKAVVMRKNRIYNYFIYALCKIIWFILSPFKSDNFAQTPEDNGYYYAIPKKFLYPITKVEFEGNFYPAPNMINEYLSLMYGTDYMNPPPPEKRISHSKLILPNTPCNHPRSLKRNGQSK
jgi:lipopolysaccharide cholinephosphotransferase